MKNIDFVLLTILFYIGWFGSIFFAKANYSILSYIFPILMICYLLYRKIISRRLVLIAIGISFLGLLIDYILILFDIIDIYNDSSILMPHWLISIWLIFSISILKLGSKISPPIWLASLLGFIFGPLSYKSGEAFDLIKFNSIYTSLFYAVLWGIIFPILLKISKRIE